MVFERYWCFDSSGFFISNEIEETDWRTIFLSDMRNNKQSIFYPFEYILSTSFVSLTDTYGNLIHQTSPVRTDRTVC
jgi:hypothetical protein